jgi:hypothetical protein
VHMFLSVPISDRGSEWLDHKARVPSSHKRVIVIFHGAFFQLTHPPAVNKNSVVPYSRHLSYCWTS